MMKHNIFVVLLLTCCFVKSAENDIDRRVITGRLIFELGGIPEEEMQKLRDEVDKEWSRFNAFDFYFDRQKLSEPETQKFYAFMKVMEIMRTRAPRESVSTNICCEPVIRREPVSCD